MYLISSPKISPRLNLVFSTTPVIAHACPQQGLPIILRPIYYDNMHVYDEIAVLRYTKLFITWFGFCPFWSPMKIRTVYIKGRLRGREAHKGSLQFAHYVELPQSPPGHSQASTTLVGRAVFLYENLLFLQPLWH